MWHKSCLDRLACFDTCYMIVETSQPGKTRLVPHTHIALLEHLFISVAFCLYSTKVIATIVDVLLIVIVTFNVFVIVVFVDIMIYGYVIVVMIVDFISMCHG